MTTTAKQTLAAIEGRLNEIRQLLTERHPESRDLLNEQDNLQIEKSVELEAAAVRRQGTVIMAASRGDIVAWDELSSPEWNLVSED